MIRSYTISLPSCLTFPHSSIFLFLAGSLQRLSRASADFCQYYLRSCSYCIVIRTVEGSLSAPVQSWLFVSVWDLVLQSRYSQAGERVDFC